MADESHLFGGLELNDGLQRKVLAHSFRPAQEKPDLIGGSDSEGVVLARRPRPEALTHEITVRVRQQATWDAAGRIVAGIVQRAAECAMRPDGLPHVWTPQGATEGFTAYVLHAQVTEVPISQQGDGAEWGWLDRSPVLKIALTCKPYWYGPEVEGDPVTASDSVVTVTLSDVTGDVDAEGRIIVTNNEADPIRHLEWGLDHRLLDAATGYTITSDDLVTAGYAGTQSTRAGANSGDVVTCEVASTPTSVCAIALTQAHVGRFKVRARIWSSDVNVRVRLLYRSGDRPFEPTATSWVSPPSEGFCDIDLGDIVIRPAALGAQLWEGRIDSYNPIPDPFSATTYTTIEMDEVNLMPVERYGIARARYRHDTGLLVADDRLDAISGALDAEVARLGGTWDTSGATTDFANTTLFVSRATTLDASPRFAILPAGGYTSIELGVGYTVVASGGAIPLPGGGRHHGVVARFLDSANYLRLSHQVTTSLGDVWVEKVLAGVATTICELGGPLIIGEHYYLRLVVYETGLGIATLLTWEGVVLDQRMFHDDDLALGGTLDTGDIGIIDMNGSGTASERFYSSFTAAIPVDEPVVIKPSLSLEVRHDGVLREAAGDLWGEPWYRGDRVLIPPSGFMDRDTRIAVRARIDDVAETNDTEPAPSITVQVNYTPRSRMPARVA